MPDRKTLVLPEPFNVLWEEMRAMRKDVQRLAPLLDLLDTAETAEELGPGAIAALIVEIDTRQRRLDTHLTDLTDSITTMQSDLAAVRALLAAPLEPTTD